MNSRLLASTLFLAVVAALSCKNGEPQPAPSMAVASAAPVPSVVSCAAQEALDRFDARREVPLLPMMAHHQKQNMRDHLVAVQQVVAGLATSDFAGIEKAAARMGFSEQMGAMCTHMGAGATGFGEQAIAFHKTADAIAGAAKAKDSGAVLAALGTTLETCTGCHASWKQHVVDDAAWTRATARPPPSHTGGTHVP